jgi:hypothetical protein
MMDKVQKHNSFKTDQVQVPLQLTVSHGVELLVGHMDIFFKCVRSDH